MGDPFASSGTPGTVVDGDSTAVYEPGAKRKTQYLPYRPPGSEFTPPASPQPTSPHPYAAPAVKKSFGSQRSRHPADLQMDTAVAPAYERPTYSPTPSSSPPLPPLPSPHIPPRQRAPSLLRHAAASSPLNDGFPRAEQSTGSPTFAPSMLRQGSGHGPTSDPRTIFNPLASNPVGQPWPTPREDAPSDPETRPRGMTSPSQQDFIPHPPLRSATSIPDYGQYRGSDRPIPSGAYRPNRGGANWSHNEYYQPPRHFRNEEPRASYRSAWTNASSSFVDASGTERSSMATGRSSTISENRMSVVSGDHGEQDATTSPAKPDDLPEEDYEQSAVEDVIDAYCYGDDEEVHGEGYTRSSQLDSSLVDTSDVEAPDLSRSYSHGGSSNVTSEPNATPGSPEHLDRPISYVEDRDAIGATDAYAAVGPYDVVDDGTQSGSYVYRPHSYDPQHSPDAQKQPNEFLPSLRQLSPLQLQYSPTKTRLLDAEEQKPQDWPSRDDSIMHAPDRDEPISPISPVSERSDFRNIHQELKDLPQLPNKKSRISRQDWDNFQAYSKKNIHARDGSEEFSSQKRPPLAVHIPSSDQSDQLPEVDEDEAYPRRASTSVFDRKSTLLEFTKAIHSPPLQTPKRSGTLDPPEDPQPMRRLDTGLTAYTSDPSPITPTSPLPSLSTTGSVTQFPRDRYGFKKATDKISVQDYDAWYGRYEHYVSRRRGKWVALMEKQGLPTSNPVRFPERSEKVRRYTRKGHPPEWRGAMWWFYSGGPEKLASMSGVYASLVARIREGELNKDDREAIERDLDRTFPDNVHFRPDPTPENPDGKLIQEPEIVQNLREVLQCFALNNPNIGYCQSLNFIAGLLLLFMQQDNERVFILLTIITQTHLPGAHARSLANTEVNVLMMLIKEYLPKVWNSINDTDLINNGAGSHAHPDSKFQRQPTVALSCTSWFMSIFVGVLPIEVVLRVWDAFLYEGPRALYRYALAIFKLGEPEIKKYHPGDGELFMTVQNLPRKCLDPNVLHDLAFVKKGFGSLSQNVIDQKRQFWTQQLAREKSGRTIRPVPQTTKGGFLGVHNSDSSDERKGSVGGLRRKASRKFFKKDR